MFTKHLTQDREQFKNYRYSLLDWAAVTEVGVSAKAIDQVAQLRREFIKINPDSVVAHVANQKITFGLSRVWEMLVGEPRWETMVFRAREESEVWIEQRIMEKYGLKNLTLS